MVGERSTQIPTYKIKGESCIEKAKKNGRNGRVIKEKLLGRGGHLMLAFTLRNRCDSNTQRSKENSRWDKEQAALPNRSWEPRGGSWL